MERSVHLRHIERAELERLRARLGRLFAALQEAAEVAAFDAPGVWLPPVDVCESEEAVTVSVELPGVRPADVEVRVSGSELRVTGRKRKGAPRGLISHLCSERSYGQFRRTVALRWPVRVEAAAAELRDGLLTVRLPKLTERRGAEYKIEVTGDR